MQSRVPAFFTQTKSRWHSLQIVMLFVLTGSFIVSCSGSKTQRPTAKATTVAVTIEHTSTPTFTPPNSALQNKTLTPNAAGDNGVTPIPPNVLRVKRVSNMPPPEFEWERTIEGIQVDKFHRRLVSLLPSPHRESCPISFGTDYYLTFLKNSQVIDEIIINAGGCRSAWMNGIIKRGTDQRDTDDAFWKLFAEILNLSVQDLQTETQR